MFKTLSISVAGDKDFDCAADTERIKKTLPGKPLGENRQGFKQGRARNE
ncbi:MAG: hypothetical protein LBH85_08340 [Treponema sp.]|jgi:hypothetical protein|nr:hypothetical protein [Treponema sp.]